MPLGSIGESGEVKDPGERGGVIRDSLGGRAGSPNAPGRRMGLSHEERDPLPGDMARYRRPSILGWEVEEDPTGELGWSQ